jgi:hypothetical protein
MHMTMKVITGVALALATVLASPAMAQSARVNAYQAYGQADYGRPDATNWQTTPRSWNVYNTNNRFVGADPDPNVRDMIARDRNEQLGTGF